MELDPVGDNRVRAKSNATSLIEKKARKFGTSNKSPFFYNTMPALPRSSSIPALNQGFMTYEKPMYKIDTSPLHRPAASVIASNKHRLPLSPVDQQLRSNKRASPLKKYTSEINIVQKTQTRDPDPVKGLRPTTGHSLGRSPTGRRPLGSFSEVSLIGGRRGNTGGGMRSSISCHNLSSNLAVKKPNRFLKDPSPEISPPVDSEDGFSYYSSMSDLSHEEISSDSDLTPRSRSSSTSPCFIDVDSANVNDNISFVLKPPSPKRTSKSTSQSPTHRVSLPTGLATPTSSFIESSKLTGSGEYRVPSPEHQKNSKIYQNGRNGRSTLEHPLVNGHAAYNNKTATTSQQELSSKDKNVMDSDSWRVNEVFVCPSSGQEIPKVLANYLVC